MSTSNGAAALRLPSYSGRTGASPMSFGAAMSGVSFNNGGGQSYGRYQAPGSYGARFYGDAHDSPGLFSTSINMDMGSFAASSAMFGLPMGMSSSYARKSYAAAVGGREYGVNALSASLASVAMGSLGRSYSRSQLETLMSLRTDAELTKEYECCGLTHHGLHALLEHVEDQHPYSDPNMPDAGFSPVTLAMDLDLEGDGDTTEPPSTTQSARSSTSPRPMYPLTPSSSVGHKPDPPATAATTVASKATAAPTAINQPPGAAPTSTVTALSLSDVLKSPPESENPSLLSSLPVPSASTSPESTATATNSSPPFAAPKITAASRGAFLGPTAKTGQNRFDRAFNEVVSGKAGLVDDAAKPPGPTAVAPGVLFTAAAALGMPSAPQVVGRRDGVAGSGAAGTAAATATTTEGGEQDKKDEKDATANGDRPKPPEPQLPQPSLFTTHKAWRCPNPGCNKAYKQSNGLKYHLQKGQCDFAIHDAIDHGLTLEEAEERSRPYVCAVGAGCTKRYRQMNGLKYHYLNSGEHGEYGLRMLQNGTHPHPPSLPPPPKRDRSQHANGGANSTANARPNAAPYAIPSQLQRPAATGTVHTAAAQGPRMGTWPASQQARPAAATPGAGLATPARPSVATATTAAAPVRPTATPAAAATTAASAAKPQLAPVQRGRDAVLFSSVDLTDV
ncbi:hypothetical protein Q8F55_001306 [Vanrija albida]|uniref:C2H2-type domain-containing protein n=1 Tax=Vanrija albida TaxID=181172 RepID=A0ABR3QFU9_9TREE